MRDVEDDDLLLSRGANPRTGVISPDKLSFDDTTEPSEDSLEPFQASDSSPQWQQRGGQWVNTRNRYEKSRLPYEGRAAKSNHRTGLRKPQKLVGGYVQSPSSHEQNKRTYDTSIHAWYRSPKQCLTPSREYLPVTQQVQQSGSDHEIVTGHNILSTQTTPITPTGNHMRPSDPESSSLVPAPLLLNGNIRAPPEFRSSSAPTPQNGYRVIPNNRRPLPQVPERTAEGPSIEIFDKTDLSPLSNSANGSVRMADSKTLEHFTSPRLDKELPQLPMNEMSSHHVPIKGSPGMKTPPVKPTLGSLLTVPKSRYASSPLHQPKHSANANTTVVFADTERSSSSQGFQIRRKMPSSLAAIPVYDNPPKSPMAKTALPPVLDSEMTDRTKHVSQNPISPDLQNKNGAVTKPIPGSNQSGILHLGRLPVIQSITSPELQVEISKRCSRCHRSYDGYHIAPDLRKLSMCADGPEVLPPGLFSRSQAEKMKGPSPYDDQENCLQTGTEAFITNAVRCIGDDRSSSGENSLFSQLSRSSDDTTLVEGTNQETPKPSLLDHDTCCQECCSSGCHIGCLGHMNPSSRLNEFSTTDHQSDHLTPPKSVGTQPHHRNVPHIRQVQASPTSMHSPTSRAPTAKVHLEVKKIRPPKPVRGSSLANIFDFRRHRQMNASPRPQISDTDENNNQLKTSQDQNSDLISPDRKITPLTGWTKVTKKARTVSTSSVRMIGIPSLRDLSMTEIWDLLIMPIAAFRMWLANNPQLKRGFWFVIQYYWKMVLDIHATTQVLLNMIYVYSKTGKVNTTQDVVAVEMARDCLRSVLYAIILVSSIRAFIRFIMVVFFPVTVLVYATKWLLSWIASSSVGTT